MTLRDGSLQTGTVNVALDGAATRFVGFSGTQQQLGGAGTWYKLAALDAVKARQVWMSHSVTIVDAPTGGGVTLPYDTSTITILGTVP